MKRIGVLGSGAVGETLANGFLKHGYEVMRGSREPVKLESWKSKHGPEAWIGTFAQCAEFGELLVLAVKGGAAESAIDLSGPHISGKTVIDATNPLDETPPVNGVLSFFTGPNESLMERLQRRAPSARFVKAFSSVGNSLMVNPDLGQKPTMFICGNDAAAKRETTGILDQFGWEAEDMGTAEAARAIEPLCILWCIPGFLRNDWVHAFKLLKKG
ncbi:MAG TPA: NAD(P)-binding domain-containing protein [Polyangiaceae bacterium]|nr:NAD(P)-binding domain-containing protein [Polyangiaceae bacterium]